MVNRGGKYYFVGSCKAYFFITGNCQFILSFVALKITIVNVIPNKAVCSCFAIELCKLQKNNVYANSYVGGKIYVVPHYLINLEEGCSPLH